MKKLLFLLPLLIGCDQQIHIDFDNDFSKPGNQRLTNYPAYQTPYPTVDIQEAFREQNWTGPQGEGSCVHASMVMLFRWQGQHELANKWRRTYSDGEWDTHLAKRFDAEGVRYAYTSRQNDVRFLEWACQTRRGCGVTVKGDSNLKSIPVGVLLLDEVDEMSQRAISLALERLSGQLSKTVWGISTPTIPNFGIHKLFKGSTQEHFTFKCPCCGRSTELIWPDCIEIIGEHVTDPRCAESFLKCKECGGKLYHPTKPDWLGEATWQPNNHGANPDVRGFAISQLYSFTVTPGELVVAYFRGLGDEAANVEFYNSKLGLPFIGDGAKVTDADIDACIKNYSKEDPRPIDSSKLITMGVDQGKWNYVEVAQWDVRKLTNDLNASAKPKVLYETTFHEEDWYRFR